MNHVWLATLRTPEAKERLVNTKKLCIKNLRCVVVDPCSTEERLPLHWVPFPVHDDAGSKLFKPYGKVIEVSREKWRVEGFEAVGSTTGIVRMTDKSGVTPDGIPEQRRLQGGNVLIVFPGRAPVCLRCKRAEHRSATVVCQSACRASALVTTGKTAGTSTAVGAVPPTACSPMSEKAPLEGVVVMDEATDSPKRDLEDTPPSPGRALNPNTWFGMEKNKRGHSKAVPYTATRTNGRPSTASARAAWGSGTAAAALPAPASAASAAAAPDVSIQRWTGPSRGACIVQESGVGVECGRVESRAWALVLAAWWGTVHAAVMRLPGPRRDCNQVNAGGDL
ncbi:hypothetical protein HPB47_013180 [Ixodes persulcatus]|uniref:Uncharacterized protein n=1 Tax=Ixodes persulcatus TaxID=34615 RepID=A0AC60NRH6_IXOPE|nr:hypothetical protein HPB47_013180 [Ixodes persulcatus]